MSALVLTCSGCLRFGYAPADDAPDASHKGEDAGVMRGLGGRGGAAGAPRAGSGDGDTNAGAAASDPLLGDTGLHVSDILGFYSGDWGDMVLQRRGAEIWGVYRYNDGTIIGVVQGNGVFAGWWSQLPTRVDGVNAGEVEFRWTQSKAGVISLDGRWRYGSSGTWLQNWDVDLVKERSAPSELLDAFKDTEDFKRHP